MKGFQIIEGKVNILISAPHSAVHFRDEFEGMYRPVEIFTDYICRNIAKNSGCWGIFLSEEVDYDPNFNKKNSNEYKETVEKLIKKNNIKLFIDIHGLKDIYQYDFGIYFKKGFHKSKNIAYEISKAINKGVMRTSLFQLLYFKNDNQETLSEFVSQKMKIPAIQIEIARYIRDDDLLKEQLIKNLTDYIISSSL